MDNVHGAVILVHGFGGDMHEGGLFTQLSQEAIRHGLITLSYNWRGIPPSKGNFGTTTMAEHVRDLEALTLHMTKEFSDVPNGVSAIGFSLGAAVIGLLTRRHPNIFNRIVLISPAMRPNISMWPRYNTKEIWDQVNRHGFAIKPGSNISLGLPALAILRDTDLGDHAFEFESSLLVCHGTLDERIPIQHSRELIAVLPEERDVVYMEINGASHSFRNQKHRNVLIRTTINYLTAPTKEPAPSGPVS